MASILWFTAIGWLVIPVINFLVNKLLSYLDFNLARKLRELELTIVPNLKQILEDVTEQRILRGAKDEDKGHGYDLKTLGELDKDLKSALYEAEDVLDVVDYHRIEKKVIGGDRKVICTTIWNWVVQAIGDWIAYCKRSSFGQTLWHCTKNQYQKLRGLGDKLQQWVLDLDLQFWDLVAILQQYAHNLSQMFWDFLAKLLQCAQSSCSGQPPMPDAPAARSTAEFRDDIEQGSSTPDDALSNQPLPNALPNAAGSTTGDQHGSAEEAPNSLVQMIYDWMVYWFSALRSFYLAARHLRDWSYELVGIKGMSGL